MEGQSLTDLLGDLRAGGPLAEDLVQVVDEQQNQRSSTSSSRWTSGWRGRDGFTEGVVAGGQLADQQELPLLPPKAVVARGP